MSRGPIEADIHAGGASEPGATTEEAFREALSRWASGVTIVAVRDEGRVHATTVSSFASVSARPPLILVCLGPGAQVLPFLKEGTRFAVSILTEDQRRLASVFADSFPVGPSPFPREGPPLLPDAHATLVCSVHSILPAESARLVLGLVEEAHAGEPDGPLLHYHRGYRELE